MINNDKEKVLDIAARLMIKNLSPVENRYTRIDNIYSDDIDKIIKRSVKAARDLVDEVNQTTNNK